MLQRNIVPDSLFVVENVAFSNKWLSKRCEIYGLPPLLNA